jgi:hypothetical protein
LQDRTLLLEEGLGEMRKGIENLAEVTDAIVGVMGIDQALDRQDEVDRHSISLWGMQERAQDYMMCKTDDQDTKYRKKIKRDGKNVVSVDQK